MRLSLSGAYRTAGLGREIAVLWPNTRGKANREGVGRKEGRKNRARERVGEARYPGGP